MQGEQQPKRRFKLTTDLKIALFSYFVMGTTTWLLVGTTTLVSVILWAANTLQFQGYIAKTLSDTLTRETGIQITFESAIVPRWKNGHIRLNKVRVVREEEEALRKNYASMDLTIQQIDVKLSLWWFLEGNGLLKEMILKGVRGHVDRRRLVWTVEPADEQAAEAKKKESSEDEDTMTNETVKPHSPNEAFVPQSVGAFCFSKLTISDLYITLYNANPKRPLPVSIYSYKSAHLVRSTWLLHDLLYAEYVHGSFDDCLFTLNKPHLHNHPYRRLMINEDMDEDRDADEKWKFVECKLQGLNIDHLAENTTGPLNWITSGFIDINVHLLLPPFANTLPPAPNPSNPNARAEPRLLSQLPGINMDFKLVLTNLSASVPLSTPHMSYVNSALIQPIVLYLNTNYTELPLTFRSVIPQGRFWNAWYPGDCGFWDALSEGAGAAIEKAVSEQTTTPNIWKLIGLLNDGVRRGLLYYWRFHVLVFLGFSPE